MRLDRLRFLTVLFLLLSAFCLLPTVLLAQQPTSTAPLFEVNSHYVGGRTWADYKASAGAGLTLNVAAGTAFCGSPPVKVTYAGGTLTMTNAATNYVYLNPAATCVPASNTTGFTVGVISLAQVVAAGGAITGVTDVRTWFVDLTSMGGGITTLNTLTGATQTFATPGTTGTAPNWVSSGSAHTLHLPMAATASVTAGLISKTQYDIFNGKQDALGFTPENSANKNAASGYAGLTASTKLTTAQGQEVWGLADLTGVTGTSGSGTTALLATLTSLATGDLLKWSGTNWVNTVSAAKADALTSDPTDCSTNQFANAIGANGNLGCAQPTWANIDKTTSSLADLATRASTNLSDSSALVRNNQANTYSTGAQDFGSATSFKVPVAAGAAPATSGFIAYDSTNNNFHGGLSSADSKFASFTVTPAANNNCVKWLVSGSNYLLGDAGAACGSGGSGDNISVNGTAATDADFDDATPAAPSNAINVKWQRDTGTPNNLSAYVPYAAPLTVTGGNLTVAAVLKTRQIGFMVGADTGAVLADTDDQADIYVNRLGQGITITEVWCACDAGSPIIQLQKDDGSPTNMLSSNLTCSAGAGASTTSFVSGENAMADGTRLDYLTVTAGGTAKRITVYAKYTLD
jgi:hypothetical protein